MSIDFRFDGRYKQRTSHAATGLRIQWSNIGSRADTQFDIMQIGIVVNADGHFDAAVQAAHSAMTQLQQF